MMAIEFREINKNVVNVLFTRHTLGYGTLKTDGGMINRFPDGSVTWKGRTIAEMEQILSKMKELQGENNGY